MKTFKERLQYVIDEKKITQRDVADGIGVDEARLSVWLTGKVKKPHRTTVRKLAEFFDCDFKWLADNIGEPFPPTKTIEQFGKHKETKEINSTLSRMLREKFKQQCASVYLDEFMDFLAENYGEDKEGVDAFLAELSSTNSNYRKWVQIKKDERGSDEVSTVEKESAGTKN